MKSFDRALERLRSPGSTRSDCHRKEAQQQRHATRPGARVEFGGKCKRGDIEEVI
jgi:hypothetical protein